MAMSRRKLGKRVNEGAFIFFLLLLSSFAIASSDVDNCGQCDNTFVNDDGDNITTYLNITSTDTIDPTLRFLNGNGIDIYLDVSAGTDHLDIVGRTAGVDTLVHVISQPGENAQLALISGGFANRTELIQGQGGTFSIQNKIQDKDIRFYINDGGVEKFITWDASSDTLEHSSGLFNFNNDNLTTNGNLTANNVIVTGELWEDIRVPVTSTKLGGSKDPPFSVFATNGAGSQGVFTYFFSASQEQELYFVAQVPHNYKLNTALESHVHWTPTTTSTLGVVWGLEYTWANLTDVLGDTNIITATVNATGVINEHILSSLGNLTGSSNTPSSILLCRVFRDATAGNDSYAGTAALLEVDFHYQVDGLGSDDELSKSW